MGHLASQKLDRRDAYAIVGGDPALLAVWMRPGVSGAAKVGWQRVWFDLGGRPGLYSITCTELGRLTGCGAKAGERCIETLVGLKLWVVRGRDKRTGVYEIEVFDPLGVAGFQLFGERDGQGRLFDEAGESQEAEEERPDVIGLPAGKVIEPPASSAAGDAVSPSKPPPDSTVRQSEPGTKATIGQERPYKVSETSETSKTKTPLCARSFRDLRDRAVVETVDETDHAGQPIALGEGIDGVFRELLKRTEPGRTPEKTAAVDKLVEWVLHEVGDACLRVTPVLTICWAIVEQVHPDIDQKWLSRLIRNTKRRPLN